MYIILLGDPVVGFTYHGPFPRKPEATAHAEQQFPNDCWWVVPLALPNDPEVVGLTALPVEGLDSERMTYVLNRAHELFWLAVVSLYPEVQRGDMDPIDTFKYETAMQQALAAWLIANHPAFDDADELPAAPF